MQGISRVHWCLKKHNQWTSPLHDISFQQQVNHDIDFLSHVLFSLRFLRPAKLHDRVTSCPRVMKTRSNHTPFSRMHRIPMYVTISLPKMSII